MAHALWQNRLVLYRKPAWHHLGTVIEQEVDAITAANICRMDSVAYRKAPAFVDMDDFNVHVEVPNVSVLFRVDTADPNVEPLILGTCDPDYPTFDGHEFAELMQPLSETMPVETAGLLVDGRTMFMTLRMGGGEIAGDEVKHWFLATQDATPGKAMTIAKIVERVVCVNTLQLALGSALTKVRIPHNANFKADAKWYVDLQQRLGTLHERSIQTFSAMAEARLDQPAVENVLAATYPIPQKPARLDIFDEVKATLAALDDGTSTDDALDVLRAPAERRYAQVVQRVESHRNAVSGLYDRFNQEHPRAAGTAWALYNAVAEWADHRKGNNDYDQTGRAESTLWGPRSAEKDRAMRALLAEAKVAVPA